jgi:DNA-binding MarR family transcriptional regulator
MKTTMKAMTEGVEQHLTVLLRRGHRVHLWTQSADITLDRSAYGIMCQLADEGPQRPGELAAAFGLDPSTITRQVQSLERAELATRQSDPSDGRVSILDLTVAGRGILEETRDHRRSRLERALEEWTESEIKDFGRLLQKFNASIDRLAAEDSPARMP